MYRCTQEGVLGVALSVIGRYLIVVMAIRGEILPVGPPVQLEWQIGRTRDIEEVRLAVENGEHVVLIDPLHAISRGDWTQGLIRAFRALGCSVSDDAITELLEESGGQPHRTMLIARETHRIVQTSTTPKAISRGHVVAAVQAARADRLWPIGEGA